MPHQYSQASTTLEGPNPSGLCQCGCGQMTGLAGMTNWRTGALKGQPRRFIRGHAGLVNGLPSAEKRERDRQGARQDAEQRRIWYGDFMQGRVCKTCGHDGSEHQLQWHHRDPKTKKYSIGQVVTTRVRIEIVLAEIDKCDLLCSKCHVEAHIRLRRLADEAS